MLLAFKTLLLVPAIGLTYCTPTLGTLYGGWVVLLLLVVLAVYMRHTREAVFAEPLIAPVETAPGYEHSQSGPGYAEREGRAVICDH